jgi:TRAP-type C4-dicarboxylate transport system permease small subunit
VSRAESGEGQGRVLGLLYRLEDALLALILGLLVLLAPLQILLRNVFDTGISWGDPLLRVLVLWIAMLGALAATRGRRQISIDALSHLAGKRVQSGVGIVTSLFASVVCGIVAHHSARFVASEIEYQSVAFEGVPAWTCEIVIPVAFGLMALRYLLYSVGDVRALLAGTAAEERR